MLDNSSTLEALLLHISVFIVNQHTQNKLKIGVWYKFSGFSFLLLFKLQTYWVGKGFRIRHFVPSSVLVGGWEVLKVLDTTTYRII